MYEDLNTSDVRSLELPMGGGGGGGGVRSPDERIYLSPSHTVSVDFNSKLWWDNLLNWYSPSRDQSYVSDRSFCLS